MDTALSDKDEGTADNVGVDHSSLAVAFNLDMENAMPGTHIEWMSRLKVCVIDCH